MPKSLTLGNGNILVCLDKNAEVRDFYFPHVGLENHIGEDSVHRIGVYADGRMHWFSSPEWDITIQYMEDANASRIVAVNSEIGIKLYLNDAVYNERPILLRRITVVNLRESEREVKIFFNQEFNILESRRRDTAYYDPRNRCVVHYQGKRVFLVNGMTSRGGIDDYTVGLYQIEGMEGSFRDAEDGTLAKNPIEHGLADSVIGFHLALRPQGEERMHYWIAAARSVADALLLNDYCLEKTPEHLLRTTHDFWSAWVNRQNFNFYGLSPGAIRLFKSSLFIIRSHVDETGAVIASGDSDMLQYGRDTYSYMWPRDGAFSVLALDKAGDSHVARSFFEFCNTALSEEGYFMHKYRPDGALGSSWHPWVTSEGDLQLPIQEDETALVLFALWEHYRLTKDLEFIESIYNSFIQKAANFMSLYRDKTTGLPKASYDIWEERLGSTTFTASAVYGALVAACQFAHLLGKTEDELRYKDVALEIREGIVKYLYDEESGAFLRMIRIRGEEIVPDKTIDISSVYGAFYFGVFPKDDPRMKRAFAIAEEKLSCARYSGGFARYEGDRYYRSGDDIPGNPWFVTTLWMVQYSIAVAREEKDIERVREWFNWVVSLAPPSGVLSEQLNPYTKEQISASPLTWSHSEYVLAVIAYLEKLEDLGICLACAPIPNRLPGSHS